MRTRSHESHNLGPLTKFMLQKLQSTLWFGPTLTTFRFVGLKSLKWLLIGIGSSLLLAVCDLSLSMLLQGLLKALRLLPADSKLLGPIANWNPSPTELGVLLVCLGLLRAVGQLLQNQSFVVALENMNARLRLLTVYELLGNKQSTAQATSSIHLNLSEVFPKAGQFCNHSTAFVSLTLQSLAMIGFMFWTSWRETLVGILGIGVIGVGMLSALRLVSTASAKVPGEQASLLEGIERVARNWLLVRVLNTQDMERKKLVENVVNYSSHSLRAAFMSYVTMAIAPFFGIVLICLIIYLSQTLWSTEGLRLISFLYLFIRFVQNLASQFGTFGNMISFYPQFKLAQGYYLSVDRERASKSFLPAKRIASTGAHAKTYFEENSQEGQGDAVSKPQEEDLSPPPSIQLRGLSFRYPGATINALKSVSLFVSGGRQLAILGPSGSGKSTLLCALMGMLEPTEGFAQIAGLPPSEFLKSKSNRVGYVGVDPFLFAGSIRQNLLYGCNIARSESDLWNALLVARIDNLVRSLEGGLESQLPEGGHGLSAGQKQRLSLARALLSKPCILVLDEASSNLDADLEAQLAESIRELKGICTVVIVSHRQGFVKYADEVLELSTSQINDSSS